MVKAFVSFVVKQRFVIEVARYTNFYVLLYAVIFRYKVLLLLLRFRYLQHDKHAGYY